MNKKLVQFFLEWFGTGRSKKAPGTVGTLGAIPLYIIFHSIYFSGIIKNEKLYNMIYFVFLIFLFFVSIYMCDFAEKNIYHKKDPQQVVLDEVLGYMTALFMVNPTNMSSLIINVVLAFALFRLFDITKPLFIDRVQEMKNGVGVVADDFLAGIVANVILIGVNIWLGI
ncbi:MAG: p [Fusobacteriales bacterium]|jgi:phosphatidylglycerophosphatase A|nr:p [Fusobacteriales bacterium]